MKAKTKKKWLKALRSGKFKQSSHALYVPEENGYCCLGVLGRVKGVSKKQLRDMTLPYDVPSRKDRSKDHSGLKPKVRIKLADMNDVKKMSFSKIADWIEANVKTDRS